MLDKLKYTNHLNEVIQFGESPYFVNQSDLRDFEWSYDAELTRFSMDSVVQKALPVMIVASTEEEATEAKNRLYEVFEKDVLANLKGTFEINGYKMRGFVTASKKDNYLVSKHLLTTNLTIVTDTPKWIEEKTFNFFAGADSNTIVDYGRDYAESREYPYGYNSEFLNSQNIYNDHFFSCGFRMNIYGAVENPTIIIGGKTYKVDVTVDEGERLEIVSDGKTKTVTLHKTDGTTEDCFAHRYKPQSVFAKIETGLQEVSWANSFGFDLILLKERSEPEWR